MAKPVKKSFWFKLISVPVLMFGFAYAMVPLYDILCDITGLNGKTGVIDSQKPFAVNAAREVTIDFWADSANGFPVEVKPEVTRMTVVPGRFYTVNYIARNTSNQTIEGHAVPSVAPEKAALHFKKLECFCFTKQTFLPKQTVKMPVRFVIEPKMDDDVVDVSLSYQFFRTNT